MSKPHSEFVVYLLELLAALGEVRARRMFGGYGIYYDSLMFALVADDTLYLKVDDANRPAFAARRLAPFVYHKNGKPYSMSYYQAPDDALDSAEQLNAWAGGAIAAARRAAAQRG